MKNRSWNGGLKQKGLLWAIAVLTAFGTAACAATTLQDFNRAYELKTTMEGAIYRFSLPRFVYEGLVRSWRRDLVVFNAKGEIVPFIVREMNPQETTWPQSESVPFYALPAGKGNSIQAGSSSAVGPVDIYVQTGPEGQIVSITGGKNAEQSRQRRYILDFSSITADKNARNHRLRLSTPENQTFSTHLTVFQSANLSNWKPLLKNIPFMRLQNQDSRLINDNIELPDVPQRYLLLQVENVSAPFELKNVSYDFDALRRPVQTEYAVFEGKMTDNAVEYDLPGAFPVSEINFMLREAGIYMARIFSRPDAKSEWRPLRDMELSTVRDPSSGLRSNPAVALAPREERCWRIEFATAFSGAPPLMRIGWRPSEVFFLAQGGGPYILAFGSSAVGSSPVGGSKKELTLQSDSLHRNEQLLASALTAEIGPLLEELGLAPASKAKDTEGEGLLWQRYLVWGLLVGGGLLLSGMAWKLMKN